MSALSISSPFPIFTDIDGQPLENGYIFIGVANLGPIGNPINVYWDEALTIPAAQPIRTLGGYPMNNGTPARLYVNSDYSIQVQNKNGSVVYSAPEPTEALGGGIVNASQVVYLPSGTGAVATTVQTKLRESVSVKDFGAVGDGVTDDTAAIQAAIDASDAVFVPYTATGYKTTAPLYLSAGKALFGLPGAQVRIFKTTNIAGVGSNTFGAQTDSYVKDAVLIVTHANNAYAAYVNIENIHLTSTADSDYIIYAPRMYVGAFKNVLLAVAGGLYGFVTHDTFMFSMDEVQVAGDNSNVVGSIGFWWDDQSDGSSGTSVSFNRCWVRDGLETGYKFRGLVYSSMTACGTDKYLKNALWVELCDLSINGFGFENHTTTGSDPIVLRYSRISASALVGFTVNLGASDYLVNVQGGSVTITGLRQTSSVPGGTGLRIADLAQVILSGAAFAAGTSTTPVIASGGVFTDLDAFRYSKGTWTVSWSGLSSGLPANTTGYYTQVGNIVYFTYDAGATAISGTGGTASFTLPFTPSVNSAGSMVNDAATNGGEVLIYTNGRAFPTTFSSGKWIFSGSYQIA